MFKKIILFIVSVLLIIPYSKAQDPNVVASLKSKYSSAQYRPECGGWYFISYQKDGQTYYGFADNKGNVIASEASKYKIYHGFIELYLLDANKKVLHDQWVLDMKQYQRDHQEYLRVKTEYENELSAYKVKLEDAAQEATRRHEYAKRLAVEKARREQEAKQKQNSQSSSILGAVLSGVLQGINESLITSKIAFEPYFNEVKAERGLTVPPHEPYNPEPKTPSEPESGYYWGRYSLLQPCPYDMVDFSSIEEVGNFANVSKDGKYGLVNSKMQEIYPCTNSSKVLVSKLSDNRFVVCQNGKQGVIDSNAKTIIPIAYSSITSQDEKIRVCDNGKYGLFDYSGKEIMPCIFETMKSSNGYLLCERDNKWGVYTTNFEELYPCQFQDVKFNVINDQLFLYTQQRGLWGIVDFETGQPLLSNNFSDITTTQLNKETCYKVKKDNLEGLYASSGVLILPCEFNSISMKIYNGQEYIQVEKAGTFGLYDIYGTPLIPEGKYNSYEMKNGYMLVSANNKYGVCTEFGHELLPCKYSHIEWLKDLNVFVVKDGTMMTMVTINGTELFPRIQANSLSVNSYQKVLQATNSDYTYMAYNFNGEPITKLCKKWKQLTKQINKYVAKNDVMTSYNEKMALINDGVGKVNALVDAYEAQSQLFSYFAQNYVEKVINDWQKRGEFEKMDEWQKRVNKDTRQQKVYALTKEAQKIFISNKSKNLKDSQISILGAYDPDNETFRIKSSLLGEKELLVNVPSDDAQDFKNSFHEIKKNPSFFIENDKISLAEYSFIMPNGTTYKYSNQASLTYSVAQVDYNFDAIEIDKSASNNNFKGGKQTISTKGMIYGTSDVDVNIPLTETVQEDVYVVIISNENYENEKNVEFAYNDGQIFREYCIRALGIPEKQVHFRSDATLNNMTFEINWMKQISKACDGKAKFIFYYAGHGVPEDNMKDAYLLPVDGFSSDLSSGYKLSDLYGTLGEIPAENVLVLLDACFSGSQRSGEHMASTRGVSIKVKMDAPKGNMVVFSAASGSETAHPYREKYHGLFTYYLLSKIQKEKGALKLGDLCDFVTTNVSKTSLLDNKKSQTPTLSPSSTMKTVWRELQIK